MTEQQPACVQIAVVWNEKAKRGLCVGVAQPKPPAFEQDVVRLCWVNQRPQPNKKCSIVSSASMMPQESVGVGVGLIRASIVGETLLRNAKKVASTGKQP